ncbi:MAG: hypothetical protein P8X74_21855 [Reinekea sp.]
MLPKNRGEPTGASAIFEKQIEIKLLHSASTEEVTKSGIKKHSFSSVSVISQKTNRTKPPFSTNL